MICPHLPACRERLRLTHVMEVFFIGVHGDIAVSSL